MSSQIDVTSKEDKYIFYNTLAGVVKALERQCTIIDLRNECCVVGKITKVDGRMNIEMEEVVFYDSRGNEHVFPTFFISGRNIRYVHIPKNISSKELIEKQINRMTILPKTVKKEKSTYKTLRAKKYNKETIISLQ